MNDPPTHCPMCGEGWGDAEYVRPYWERMDELMAAEAEVERLREALRMIVNDPRNPELAYVEYLVGIAVGALGEGT